MNEQNAGGTLAEGSSTTPATTSTNVVRLGDALAKALELARRRSDGTEKPIPTPWENVNAKLPGGGYWPGCHVLVGGTGTGKTALALGLALNAARKGAAVHYIGLELDAEQVALRVVANAANAKWSDAYTGNADEHALEKLRLEGNAIDDLPAPFTIETGPPGGWPTSRLAEAVAELRAEHKEGPALVVVDFLQIVGTDDNGPRELRERIGRAAYQARHVAREHGVTVLLVSSVARDKYSSADLLKGAALDVGGGLGNPDALVGLGKESGEIEYSADSVAALLRADDGKAHNDGSSSFAIAFAKVRAGRPFWAALTFDGSRFDNGDTDQRGRIVAQLNKPPASTGGAQPKGRKRGATVIDDGPPQ